jgi:hypothetical protein
MSNLYESLKALNLEGKKITLISYGEFGFLGATQTTVKELNAKKHYQYAPDDMTDIEILHTPKRKRTSYSKIF